MGIAAAVYRETCEKDIGCGEEARGAKNNCSTHLLSTNVCHNMSMYRFAVKKVSHLTRHSGEEEKNMKNCEVCNEVV